MTIFKEKTSQKLEAFFYIYIMFKNLITLLFVQYYMGVWIVNVIK